MSCRRASRELLERFRFGEALDGRSDRHLAHLETCHACREQVGLDQALVAQLRRALRARVAGQNPAPGSWEVVRQRAIAEAPRRTWSQQVARFMRFMPAGAAMAVMVFAVVSSRGTSANQFAYDHNWTVYQRVTTVSQGWQMPWWLRDRPPAPPPAPTHGILILVAPETDLFASPTRASGPLE